MTDLSKGIIEIDGFEISPNTTLEDVETYFGDKISVHRYVPQETTVKFKTAQYLSDGLYVRKIRFGENNQILSTAIIPVISKDITDTVAMATASLNASKEWLKKNLFVEPKTLQDHCVYYWFDAVDYYASVREDRDYGMNGGLIEVSFHGA